MKSIHHTAPAIESCLCSQIRVIPPSGMVPAICAAKIWLALTYAIAYIMAHETRYPPRTCARTFRPWLDAVHDDHEPLLVTRAKRTTPVVVIIARGPRGAGRNRLPAFQPGKRAAVAGIDRASRTGGGGDQGDRGSGLYATRMNVVFSAEAWAQLAYRGNGTDPKLVRKINGLIQECCRHPFDGTGKPEPLARRSSRGYWSRRITLEHRLVYKATPDAIVIVACRFHY